MAIALLATIPGLHLLLRFPDMPSPKKASILSGVLLTAGLASLLQTHMLSPSGTSQQQATFQSVFPGTARYKPHSIANLVPEVDQLLFGSYLAPAMDPLMDYEQSVRLRRNLKTIYGSMREDPDFHITGSAMNYAYRKPFRLLPWQSDHLYTYIPETTTPCSTLIFLHGSWGPLKGYMWVLKAFADQTGVAIVAPNNGIGQWHTAETDYALTCALDYIRKHPRLNVNDLYLSGLSSSATGFCRTAITPPAGWKGICFISPDIPDDLPAMLTKKLRTGNTSIVILSGKNDPQFPLHAVRNTMQQLKADGIHTAVEIAEDEDRFLMFSQPQLIVKALTKMVRKTPESEDLSQQVNRAVPPATSETPDNQ